MTRYASNFETRDAFGRTFHIEPSKMTGRAAYVTAPGGATLGREDAERAAKALLGASGSRLRVVDPLTASYYETPALQRYYTGAFPSPNEPTAAQLREGLRLAIDQEPGATPQATVSRARTYARYLSEGR